MALRGNGSNVKKRWISSFRMLGFFLLAYFLSQSNVPRILGFLKEIEIFWFVLAVLIKSLIWLARSFQWRMVNQILGIETGVRKLLVATACTDFWAQVSPSRVGGE